MSINNFIKSDYLKYLFLIFLIIFVSYNFIFSSKYYLFCVLAFALIYMFIFKTKLYYLDTWVLFFSLLGVSVIFLQLNIFLIIKIISIFLILFYSYKSTFIPAISKNDFIFIIIIYMLLILGLFYLNEQNDISTSTIDSVYYLLDGQNPYDIPEQTEIHQQHFMYPPGMLFVYLPLCFLFGDIGYFLTNLLFFSVLLFLAHKIIFLFTRNKNLSRLGVILIFSLPLFLFESFLRWTNDMPVLFLVLFSVWLFVNEKYIFSFMVLSFAVCCKVYPIVILPIFFIILFKNKSYKKLFLSLIAFGGVFLIICFPFYLWNSLEFTHDMVHQITRPLESWEINSSAQYLLFGGYYFIISLFVLVAFYLWVYLKGGSYSIYFCISVLLFLFLFFSKTLHSNYLLFVIPFLIISLVEKMYTLNCKL